MERWQVEALGDAALLIRFGDRLDLDLNLAAHAAAAALRAAALAGVTDIAPAYASVIVRYDPGAWARSGASAYERIVERVRAALRAPGASAPAPATEGEPCVVEIPVCYGVDFGPDLDALAAHAGLDTDAVVALHSGALYRVAMLGFMPGFPYLLGLDARLHMPRRASPRTRVPRGSVAIGGAQTGIYPRDAPGGWHLIGRTPLDLFDASCPEPALLRAGQTLRFRPIDAHAFAALRP